MADISKILAAAAFAAQMHTGQLRKGREGQPYINHPLEVAHLLVSVGQVTDSDVITAALLHDVVEDTDVTLAELAERFGTVVAGYVGEVTDDKSLAKAERKRLQVEHAPHLSHGAKQIKLADKISNIRDVANNPPEKWTLQRKREYVEWGQRVVAGIRGANPKLEAYFDLLVDDAIRRINIKK